MENSEILKSRFCTLIEELDCKRSEIPKTIGITYSVFVGITDYGRLPRPSVVVRIADFFDVSVDYLVGRKNTPEFEGDHRSDFLQRYNLLKTEKKLTDYQITQKLHISTSYTTNWKKFGFVPSWENLFLLADIFGVSLDFLLGRTEDRN